MKVILSEKIKEAGDVYSFIFKADKDIKWKPGQFIFYKIPHEDADERGILRHFTISSAPYEKDIRLTTKFDLSGGSSFKKALFGLTVGASIEARLPEGKFIISDFKKKYVFIAGGIGITPFRSILLDADHNNELCDTVLLYGNKDKEIVFKEELESIAQKNKALKIHYIIEPVFIDANVINKNVPDVTERYFYISGPVKMVEIIRNVLLGLNVKEDMIIKDYFPGY